MKNVLILVITLILILAFTGITTAQEAPIPDQIKKFAPIIGHWRLEVETRDSPESSWVKSSNEWEFSWVLEGHCVQIDSSNSTGGSSVVIFGYDPQLNTIIGTGFGLDGSKWSFSSFGWDGTVNKFNFSMILPQGTSSYICRSTFVYSPDFTSSTGTYERFTDGKWWVFLKAKGTKVK